jgi:hypothetical protein
MLDNPLPHFLITGNTGGNKSSIIPRKTVSYFKRPATFSAPAAAKDKYYLFHNENSSSKFL